MAKVTKVLLLLKNMIYESTGPQEIVRFAKYYRKKGLDVVVILWGPMGVVLGKKGKYGSPAYDQKMEECIEMGVQFKCCDLGASMIGMKEDELIPGVELIHSNEIAELFIKFREEEQLILTL